jgi:succinate-semialdehyde dehydrogenase/glutarate-semialdehyde dehydrogenase
MSEYPPLKMLIDGKWLEHGAAGRMPVLNPATEAVLAHCPKAGLSELDMALQAAEKGFARWSALPGIERFKILRRGTDLLRERAKSIAAVMTAEQGKPFGESEREVLLSADIIDFLAEEAKRQGGRIVPSRGAGVMSQQVRHVPVGPVLALTPWNFPVNLPARKLGGALAAGCSVILKPAENTPASAQMLVEALVDGGLPDGAINLVFGDPGFVAETLIASPVIRKVSFTGSTAIGKRLGVLAANGMKRFTPELGGHAPVIVLGDVDVEKVVSACATAKFRNAGQVCVSPTRFFVERSIFDRFAADFVSTAEAVRVGDAGSDPGVQMGPLAHHRRLEAMDGLLEDLGGNRGEVATGGKRIGDKGFFYAPTVVVNPALDVRLMNEEPFGPLAALVPFDDPDEAINQANATPYGLASYAFTSSLDRAHRFSEKLRAGMVGINHFGVSTPETPFGGVGDSGFGSESGTEGYLAYADTKFISIAKAG